MDADVQSALASQLMGSATSGVARAADNRSYPTLDRLEAMLARLNEQRYRIGGEITTLTEDLAPVLTDLTMPSDPEPPRDIPGSPTRLAVRLADIEYAIEELSKLTAQVAELRMRVAL